MIKFDMNSFEVLLPVLIRQEKEPSNDLFFSDGHQTHQVIAFKSLTDCFECNGQYYEELIGYSLKLANEKTVQIRIKDCKLTAS